MWREQYDLTARYSVSVEDNQTWSVVFMYSPESISRVGCSDNNKWDCTCGFYSSTLILCRHICRVMLYCTIEVFIVNNLHPRWHLLISNHPLYQETLRRMNLCSEPLSLPPEESSGRAE